MPWMKKQTSENRDVNTLVGLSAVFLFIILGKIQQETLQSGQGLWYFNCCANILKPLFHGFHWHHWNKLIDNGHSYCKNLLSHSWIMGGIVTQVSRVGTDFMKIRRNSPVWTHGWWVAVSLWEIQCVPSSRWLRPCISAHLELSPHLPFRWAPQCQSNLHRPAGPLISSQSRTFPGL